MPGQGQDVAPAQLFSLAVENAREGGTLLLALENSDGSATPVTGDAEYSL